MKREYDILEKLCVAEQLTPTITVNKGILGSVTLTKLGKLCILSMSVKNSAATPAGSNIFEGNIQSPRPKTLAGGSGYYGSCGMMLQITATGNIAARIIGGTVPANGEVYGSVAYITN